MLFLNMPDIFAEPSQGYVLATRTIWNKYDRSCENRYPTYGAERPFALSVRLYGLGVACNKDRADEIYETWLIGSRVIGNAYHGGI